MVPLTHDAAEDGATEHRTLSRVGRLCPAGHTQAMCAHTRALTHGMFAHVCASMQTRTHVPCADIYKWMPRHKHTCIHARNAHVHTHAAYMHRHVHTSNTHTPSFPFSLPPPSLSFPLPFFILTTIYPDLYDHRDKAYNVNRENQQCSNSLVVVQKQKTGGKKNQFY